MENKKAYGLSIKEVIKILVFYLIIIGGIIEIPLDMVIVVCKFGKNSITNEILICLNDIICNFVLVILVLRCVRKKGAEKLKFKGSLNIKLLISTIFIFLAYRIVSASSLDILISKLPISDSLVQAFNSMTENTYLGFISIVLVAAIAEEIIMRGIILEGLLQKYNPWIAIIVSALIFGIWHMNLPQFVNAFVLGIILGIVYFKTRSLILTMVGHACNNIIVFVNIPVNIGLLAAGIILFIIAICVFIKNTNKTLKIEKNNPLQM